MVLVMILMIISMLKLLSLETLYCKPARKMTSNMMTGATGGGVPIEDPDLDLPCGTGF